MELYTSSSLIQVSRYTDYRFEREIWSSTIVLSHHPYDRQDWIWMYGSIAFCRYETRRDDIIFHRESLESHISSSRTITEL